MTTSSITSTRPASTFLAGIRDELRDRRQARMSRHELDRDLASYRRPSEINDLLAAVDRQGDDTEEAEQIRRILGKNLADYRRRSRSAS